MEGRQMVPRTRSIDVSDHFQRLESKLSHLEKATTSTFFEILQLINANKSSILNQQSSFDEDRQSRRLLEHSIREINRVVLDLSTRLEAVEKRSTEDGSTLAFVHGQLRNVENAVRRNQVELNASKNAVSMKVKELQHELAISLNGEQRLEQTTAHLTQVVQDCKSRLDDSAAEKSNSVESLKSLREEFKRDFAGISTQLKRMEQEMQERKLAERQIHDEVSNVSESFADQNTTIGRLQEKVSGLEQLMKSLESHYQQLKDNQKVALQQQAKVDEMHEAWLTLSEQFKKRGRLLVELANRNGDLTNQVAEIRSQVGNLADSFQKLDEDRTAQKKTGIAVAELTEKINNLDNIVRAEINSRRAQELYFTNDLSKIENYVQQVDASFKTTASQIDQQIQAIRAQSVKSTDNKKMEPPPAPATTDLEKRLKSIDQRLEKLDSSRMRQDNHVANVEGELKAELAEVYNRISGLQRHQPAPKQSVAGNSTEVTDPEPLIVPIVAAHRQSAMKVSRQTAEVPQVAAADEDLTSRLNALSRDLRNEINAEREVRDNLIDKLETRIAVLEKNYRLSMQEKLPPAIEQAMREQLEKQSAAGPNNLRQIKQQIQKIERIQEHELQEHRRRLDELEGRLKTKAG